MLSRIHLIEPLLEGKPVTWATSPGEEARLAYRIREALRAAKKNAATFPALASVADRFRISVRPPGKVVAELVQPEGEVKVVVGGDDRAETGGLTSSLKPMTANEIVQSLLEDEIPRKITFSGVRLVPTELERLYSWTKARNLLMFVAESGITIQHFDDSLAAFAFNPEEDL